MKSSAEGTRLKVFISYARADGSELAEELVTALQVVGFEPYLDRREITGGEDWEQRLGALIRQADTVAFVITPRSVASERCAWEVARAQELEKRIIPLVGLPVGEAQVPPALRRLNFIQFGPGTSFARGLAQLVEALRVDLEWVREHTRIGELARRWKERDRLDALLLRDEELATAQAWQAAWRAELPAVTDDHREYLAASMQAQEARANEERQRNEAMARANAERADALAHREAAVRALRRRTVAGGIAAGVLSLGIVGTAVWGVQQRERALEARIRREALRRDIAGQILAYATSPGQMAMDVGSAQGTSPYTAALLEALANRDASLWSAMSATSVRVSRDSKGSQRPLVSSDMNGDLYLSRPSPTRRQRALVIAVGRYEAIKGMDLPGVYRDLSAWAAFLRERKFEVTVLRDPTLARIEEAMDGMRVASSVPAAIRPAGLVVEPGAEKAPKPEEDTLLLVVYSGMGFRVAEERYLGATDFAFDEKLGKLSGALAVARLERRMAQAAAASVAVYDTMFMRLAEEAPGRKRPGT